MPGRQQFQMSLRVADEDIDRQGHVNNVAFLKYVQEIAIAHWVAVAPEDLRRGYTWVVRRHEIEYFRPGLPGDELTLQTRVGEPAGATWERFTEIFRPGEGRPIVSARTVWVLLDAATGRPRRVDASFLACFEDEPGDGSGR